ncbi:MAG: hypothetical protein WA190_00105 [Usitatibacter sp.]
MSVPRDCMVTLKGARASSLYLMEAHDAKVGYGMKRGTVVVYIDSSTSTDMLTLDVAPYDKQGRVLFKAWHPLPELVQITRHCYERLFERLRTNSREEVVAVIARLIELEGPTVIGQEVAVVIDGVGRFHAVSVHALNGRIGSRAWLMKTFIGEKHR